MGNPMLTRHWSQDPLTPGLANTIPHMPDLGCPSAALENGGTVFVFGMLACCGANGESLEIFSALPRKSIDNSSRTSFDTRVLILDLCDFTSCRTKHKYFSEAWRHLCSADRSPRTGFQHSLELSRHRHMLILPFDLLQHTCRHSEYVISQARR